MHTSSLQKAGAPVARILWQFAALAAACALAACTSPAVITTSTLAPEQNVLAYYEWMENASPSAIETELEALNRTTPVNRLQHDVKRALLLSAQGKEEPVKEQEAMRLLESIRYDPAREDLPVDYRIFAEHWLGHLQQRDQLRDFTNLQQNTEGMLKQLEDTYQNLAERYSRLASVMGSLEKQNGLLDQQNKLMQQQIEALTLIEQQLVGREQPQTTVPAAIESAE